MAVVWGRYYMYTCDIPIKKCHYVDDTVYYQQKISCELLNICKYNLVIYVDVDMDT